MRNRYQSKIELELEASSASQQLDGAMAPKNKQKEKFLLKDLTKSINKKEQKAIKAKKLYREDQVLN